MFESSRIGEGPPGPYVYVFGVVGACMAGSKLTCGAAGSRPSFELSRCDVSSAAV